MAQGKALGDLMFYGSSILKGAPLKVTKDGTSYRSMYEYGKLGDITCDVYYKASYTLHEGTQRVPVWEGNFLSYQTQYGYYWDTNSNIHINNFAITNGDMRIVMSNFTCKGHNVLNT